MLRFDRIIEIGLLGKALAQKSMYRRLLPRIVGILILSVTTALMLFTVLLGGFCLAYHVMIWNGVPSHIAMLTTAIMFIGLTLLFALFTALSIRRTRETFSPFSPQVQQILNSFLDGFAKKSQE